MKIASRIHRIIGYDGAALLMFEFCVFSGVLYGVILPIVERRKKMYIVGDFTLKVVKQEVIFYYLCGAG